MVHLSTSLAPILIPVPAVFPIALVIINYSIHIHNNIASIA